MKKALIVEDHAESRAWLTQTVQLVFPKVAVIEAGNLADAKKAITELPDIALVDLNLPDGSGIDLIRQIRTRPDGERCTVVVATIYDDDAHLFPALRAGASGYILKEQSREEIASLLRGIIDGAPPLSPSIARKLLGVYAEPQQDKSQQKTVSLTEREHDVLTLIAKGYRLKRAADMLDISAHTCQSHVKNIYRKLNVSSRAEVTLEATRLGIVSADR